MERVVVTGTGFQGNSRNQLQALVENSGGCYAGILHRKETTHLVCSSVIDAFGSEKYRRALQWGIPVVHWQWLVDSIAAGEFLPVSGYKTDPVTPCTLPNQAPSQSRATVQPGDCTHHHTSTSHGAGCLPGSCPVGRAAAQPQHHSRSSHPTAQQPGAPATATNGAAPPASASLTARPVLAESTSHNIQSTVTTQHLSASKQHNTISPPCEAASVGKASSCPFSAADLGASASPAKQFDSHPCDPTAPCHSPSGRQSAIDSSPLDYEMDDAVAADPMDASPCAVPRRSTTAASPPPDTPIAGLCASASGQASSQQTCHSEAAGSVQLHAGHPDMPSPVLWQPIACRQATTTAAARPGAFGLPASRKTRLSTCEDTAATSAQSAGADASDDDDDNDLIIPETQLPNDEPCTPYACAPCHTTNLECSPLQSAEASTSGNVAPATSAHAAGPMRTPTEAAAAGPGAARPAQATESCSPDSPDISSQQYLEVERQQNAGRPAEGTPPLLAGTAAGVHGGPEGGHSSAACSTVPPGTIGGGFSRAMPAAAAGAQRAEEAPCVAPSSPSSSSVDFHQQCPKQGTDVASFLQAFAKHVPGRSVEGPAVNVEVLKQLSRGTKGNSVKERHSMPSTKSVVFAEQLQVVAVRPLLLNVKDKTLCVVVGRRRSDSSVSVVIAEPFCLYKLPDGEWWMEYHRFYSMDDLAVLGQGAVAALNIPEDFSEPLELLKSLERHHCRMAYVLGGVKVSKVKKTSRRKNGDSGFFWRCAFDPILQQVVTDQSAADFIAQ